MCCGGGAGWHLCGTTNLPWLGPVWDDFHESRIVRRRRAASLRTGAAAAGPGQSAACIANVVLRLGPARHAGGPPGGPRRGTPRSTTSFNLKLSFNLKKFQLDPSSMKFPTSS